MIVRERKLNIPSGVLYSAGGVIFGILTLALAVRSALTPEPVPACSQRYMQAGLIGLERGGRPFSAEELQASLEGREWGVLQHASVGTAPDTQMKVALDVRLPKGGSDGGTYKRPVSGLGFTWSPSGLDKVSSACLAYSVWLPKGFKFAKGGVLPGLYGGADAEESATGPRASERGKQPERFAARMRWLHEGRLAVQYQTPASPSGIIRVLEEDWLRVEGGRWIRVEQEVALNTPGQSDGLLRVWIDGDMKLNQKGLVFRNKATKPVPGGARRHALCNALDAVGTGTG